ncbi:MAG: hypothetical protein ABGW69_00530 [Nanoarchaeota archaeon]
MKELIQKLVYLKIFLIVCLILGNAIFSQFSGHPIVTFNNQTLQLVNDITGIQDNLATQSDSLLTAILGPIDIIVTYVKTIVVFTFATFIKTVLSALLGENITSNEVLDWIIILFKIMDVSLLLVLIINLYYYIRGSSSILPT